jgi:hypothetical protein
MGGEELSGPARLQVDPETIADDDKPAQSGTVFNIWYLKWSGGDSSTTRYIKSRFKVDIQRDSGYTKANKPPICLFFARGCCYRGKKCHYLHRLPSQTDYFLPTQDCFGRDKTSDYKDDMNGVGSFNKYNRTLYIGGLHINDSIDATINQAFSQFGDIEKIKILHGKSCCFLTYRFEFQAQFAKEAMQNQSLSGNDILYIRWANEDPNPNAQKDEKRRLEEITISTIQNLLKDAEPDLKKQKKIESNNQPKLQITNNSIVESEPSPASSLSFNSKTLSTLKQISQKQSEEKKQEIQCVIGGYESSDDDEVEASKESKEKV